MNDNEHCQRGSKTESLVLAAELRAAGVNCVNGNETREAADARPARPSTAEGRNSHTLTVGEELAN